MYWKNTNTEKNIEANSILIHVRELYSSNSQYPKKSVPDEATAKRVAYKNKSAYHWLGIFVKIIFNNILNSAYCRIKNTLPLSILDIAKKIISQINKSLIIFKMRRRCRMCVQRIQTNHAEAC